MAEFEVKTGFDTWVNQAVPGQANPSGRFPALRAGGSGQFRTYLSMPLAMNQIAGRTILSATLSVPVQGFWVAQTVTLQAAAASWNVDRLTWANQPGVTGSTASVATGALAAGQRIEIDVTALIQAIADGQPNYGWRVTTSQSTDRSTVRGFDYNDNTWTLSVTVSDRLSKPSNLAPTGVIGLAKPTLLFDDIESLSAVQVQIDANKTSAFDFDSGWVSVTTPQLALSSTAYAGLADGSSTYWRARLKTANGSVSAWSDWVSIERHDKPAMVMDNPSGTELWDPTPTISAHLDPAGDADTRWQVIVQSVNDPTDIRYNSGDDIAGADLAHEIPLRWKGRKVFPADGNYKLIVKAWDRADRVPSPGDNPYVRTPITVTLDADAAVDPPEDLAATQETTGYPNVVLSWTRGSDPDRFWVWRDGTVLARLDPDDIRTAPGEFEWVDETAEPNVSHTYKVRARTDVGGGDIRQSPFSAPVTIDAVVIGTWLRWEGHDIELYGPDGDDPGIESEQVTKRQTFELPYAGRDVDIITAVGGHAGRFSGTVDRRADDLEATVAALKDLRENPKAVRLVWFTQNIPVDLKGLSITPSRGAFLPSLPMYDVRFEFSEIDEPDDIGG